MLEPKGGWYRRQPGKSTTAENLGKENFGLNWNAYSWNGTVFSRPAAAAATTKRVAEDIADIIEKRGKLHNFLREAGNTGRYSGGNGPEAADGDRDGGLSGRAHLLRHLLTCIIPIYISSIMRLTTITDRRLRGYAIPV